MRAFSAIAFIVGVVVVGGIGYAIGVSQSVAVTAPGTAVPVAPYYWHPFGFGFLGFLLPLFGLFLVFALLSAVFRAAAWGRWGGHHGYGYGPWREGGPRQMLEQWHREAHGETPRGGERPQGGEGEAGPRR